MLFAAQRNPSWIVADRNESSGKRVESDLSTKSRTNAAATKSSHDRRADFDRVERSFAASFAFAPNGGKEPNPERSPVVEIIACAR
jgi:hypothetical protein